MMHSTVRIVRKHVANVQKLVLLLKLKDLNQVLLKTRPRPVFFEKIWKVTVKLV